MFRSLWNRTSLWRRKRRGARRRPTRELQSPERLECRWALSASLGSSLDSPLLHRQVEGSVGYYDTQDVFRFELSETADTTLELRGLRADVDIELYDGDQNRLASSENPGSRSESLTTRLSPGVYYARVFPYRYHYTSSYQLEITAMATAPPDMAGNSVATARDLGRVSSLRTFHDAVGSTDTRDYYRFDVAGNEEVHLHVGNLEEDVDLYLFNGSRTLVAQSRNSGNASELIRVNLSAGTYYALVAPYRQASSPYALSLRSLGHLPTVPTPTQPPAWTTPSQPTNDNPGLNAPRFSDVAYYGGADDWNLNAINAPEVWSEGFTGQDVVVAVIDTGVNLQHPDLADTLWVNVGEVPGNRIDDDNNGYTDDVFGWDFVHNDNNPVDGNGHGTHVAGTIAAERNGYGATGVAYGAVIMPVQVLDSSGSGSLYDVAAGIRYAVDNGADIINLSLGGSLGTSVIRSALQYSERHGVLVAAASGNDGSQSPDYPARYSSSLSNVVSVGAHDSRGRLAGFSNGVGTSRAVQVDAPGVNIFSTVGSDQYTRYSGTSMAAPHVAGVAALALSANPGLTPSNLRSLVVEGTDRNVTGSDSHEGINAARTVARALALAELSFV